MTPRRLSMADLARWVEFRFDRSAGPGGQNVNKVSTRATLLFDYQACPRLSPAERQRITRRLATRLAHDGRLRIVAQNKRSQAANIAAAEARLLALLAGALHVPRPRKPTCPTPVAQRRRVAWKLRRGQIKRIRRSPPGRDD